MSDRIAVLDSGQIAQIGTPQQIFERPSNRFVADFIGGCNFIPAFVDPSGEFSIPASNAAAPARNNAGKPVVLAVRPQTLKFGAPEASAAFNVTVRVSDIVYLGTSVRVVLTLGDGAGMTADVDRKIAERLGLAAASFVQVWACREDLMVFDNAAGSGHGA